MRIRALSVWVPMLLGFAACGDDAAVAPAPGKSAGAAGATGVAGASARRAGAGGASAGAAGASSAGAAGQAAGTAGAGMGGGAGPGAGTAGAAGQAGGAAGALPGGAGGSTAGATAGGAAGASGGGSGPCVQAGDCAVPTTAPLGCAVASCSAGKCAFAAKDGDGDGHAAASCKALDGTPVTLGNDCDDGNPNISPSAWDGPADGNKPNRCADGIDQDCSGKADDGKTSQGATCACAPGDVRDCAEESNGKPIPFPAGPGGKPFAPCKLGAQTCLVGGTWGPCTGAKLPDDERCDDVDNDCNGTIDDVVGRGDVCDVLDRAVGACKGGGKLSCAAAVNGKPKCQPDDPRIGAFVPPGSPSEAGGWIAGFAPNGSGDWDCDGKVQESDPPGAPQVGGVSTAATCGPFDADALCKVVVPTADNPCGGRAFNVVESASCATPCRPDDCPQAPPTCGALIRRVACGTFQQNNDPCVVTATSTEVGKQLCH